MAKNYKLIFLFATILIIYLFSGCSHSSKKENISKNIKSISINNINIILENSGSMAGYLNGSKFKNNITGLIAELDKINSNNNKNLSVKNLNFYTFSDNMNLYQFSGNAFEFCDKINKKGLAIGKTSPTDDFIKILVDSSKKGNIDILITDLVIAKKDFNADNLIQSKFNIIFNSAKNKNLGTLIYRFTSDFIGKYYPVKGASFSINKPVDRPYFVFLIGPKDELNSLREYLNNSNIFKPENEINFGLDLNPHNIEILNLSNRIGNWRFKDGVFYNSKQKNNNLKFTIAFNLTNYPSFLSQPETLKKYISIQSPSLEVSSFNLFDNYSFRNKYHKKEKQKWLDNTHFLELNISQINASSNQLFIGLKKFPQNWINDFSTDNDASLNNNNNLKTYMLNHIINGIENAYHDFSSNDYYFKLNYSLNK
ncbi:MAG: hypothetical protein QXM96_03195 [Candidatus Woesearchaeota archaeon]